VDLTIKEDKDSPTVKLEYDDGDFDKSQAVNGILDVVVDTTTLEAQTYYGELTTTFGADHVDKSQDIKFRIGSSVSTT
jgi:hypothetical protein